MKTKIRIIFFLLFFSYSCASSTNKYYEFVEFRYVFLDTSTENGYQYSDNKYLSEREKTILVLVFAYHNIPVALDYGKILLPKTVVNNKELIWNIISKSKDEEWLGYHLPCCSSLSCSQLGVE